MRNKKIYQIALCCICLLLLSPSSSANKFINIISYQHYDYISINIIIRHFKFQYSYDLYTQKIKLYHDDHVIILTTGLAVCIIDGYLYTSLKPIFKKKGEIFIPYDIFNEIIKNTYPNIKFYKKGGLVSYTYSPEKNIDKIDKYSSPVDGSGAKIKFIVIDAGHGGKDPGAIGKGVKEKKLTLVIAQKVGELLKQRLKGIKIIYTRTNDRFIELADRINIANKYLKKGTSGIFISIHINASISYKISGYETYFLSQNPTNESARNTAALENNVIVLENRYKKKYKDVEYIEAMMLTTQIQKESSLLAHSIQNGMSQKLKVFKSRGVKKADFYVLRGALMPAALVEVGYITNKKELSYLKKRAYQRQIVQGLADGIIIFLKQYNKIK